MKRWRGNQRNAPGIFRLIRTDRRFGGAIEADCAWRGGICGHGSIRRASLSRRDGRSPSRSCALTAMLNLQCIWSVLFCSAASDSHSLAMHAVASEIQTGNHLWTQIEKREKMALNSANSAKKKRSLGQLTLQVQELQTWVSFHSFRLQSSGLTRAMPSSPHRRRLLLPLLVAAAALWQPLPADAACKAWLVQSIPTDMPHLRRVPGVLSTGIIPEDPRPTLSAPPLRAWARVWLLDLLRAEESRWCVRAVAVDPGSGSRQAYAGMLMGVVEGQICCPRVVPVRERGLVCWARTGFLDLYENFSCAFRSSFEG
jgi:phospholipase D3/4